MNRTLSDDERQILAIVQESLGPQNTESDVFFTSNGGAAIFAKTSDGTPCIMLHLTNLADFCRNGSATRADIIRDIECSLGQHGQTPVGEPHRQNLRCEARDRTERAMRIAAWVLLVVGLALLLYGKYFFHPPYGGIGIVVTMIGAALLVWRLDKGSKSNRPSPPAPGANVPLD